MNPTSKPMGIAEVIRVLTSLDYRSGELDEYLARIASAAGRLLETDWSVVTLSETPGYDRILASSKDIGDAIEKTYSLHGTVTECRVPRSMGLASHSDRDW